MAASGRDTDEVGGWTFDFIGDVYHDFLCLICLLPMKEPQQTKCGHCMCKLCLDGVLQRESLCPQDREPISISSVFADKRLERNIMALKVKCRNSHKECEWTGELADLVKRHLTICKKEPVPCTKEQCTAQPLREVFDWHLLHECEWRNVNCEYCDEEIIACKLKAHLETDCLECPVPCSNNCGEITSRKQLQSHLQQCPNRIVLCQYSEVGCSEKIMYKDMENHLELKQMDHMDQLLKAFLTEKKQNKCLEDKIRNSEMEIQHERKIHECQLSEIEVLQQECQQSNERAIQRLERLEHENQQLKTQMNDIWLECQRLKKWQNDTLKESEATGKGLAVQKNNFKCNFLWKIEGSSVQMPPFHIKSPVYSLSSSGYQFELHLQTDLKNLFSSHNPIYLHFGVTSRNSSHPLAYPVELEVQITVLGNGHQTDYLVLHSIVLKKPTNTRDCSTFVTRKAGLSDQEFLKYSIDNSIYIKIDITKLA